MFFEYEKLFEGTVEVGLEFVEKKIYVSTPVSSNSPLPHKAVVVYLCLRFNLWKLLVESLGKVLLGLEKCSVRHGDDYLGERRFGEIVNEVDEDGGECLEDAAPHIGRAWRDLPLVIDT